MPSLTRAKNGQTRVQVRKLVAGDGGVAGDFSGGVNALFRRMRKELELEKVGLSSLVTARWSSNSGDVDEADNGGSQGTPACIDGPRDVQETISPTKPVEHEDAGEVEGSSNHVSPFTRCVIPRPFLPSLRN
ncbi:hypothetical protein PIB30_104486 [Stylosanthes scabra]|uniref:Uncharacterized protein n=1 Tax=Stylosanthes scabra TaxID=79078 RepID=A0ABU6ZWW1_9FABA|nr:hypothetical protein [Stylosanthes scabra]